MNNLDMKKARKFGAVLAVWVGRSSLSDAARDAVDMMRYDRCYPRSLNGNTNSLESEGWLLFHQPVTPGLTPGFTLDRWESFGFKEFHEFARESYSEWICYNRRELLMARAAVFNMRRVPE